MKPKPLPLPKSPASNEDVLTALQRYHDTHDAWPTLSELVEANPGWDKRVTENRLFALRDNPTGEAPAPVVRSPGTDVYRLTAYTEPAPLPIPKPVEYDEPETLMEVPKMPKSRPDWPSDANLIRLYRTIKARGESASRIIGRRYDCTPSAVVQRLAKINEKIGSGAMLNPAGLLNCENCFDTGWIQGRVFGAACGCDHAKDGPLTQPTTAVPTSEVAESDYTTSPEDQALVDAMRAKQHANPVVDLLPIEGEQVHELAETVYPQTTETLASDLHTRPILHILEADGTIRTGRWKSDEPWPEPGDHWAEPYVNANSKRRYRQWYCWQHSRLEDGRPVFIMIPLEGVTLKPGEVA